jgi:hypothetical protein
MEQEETAPVPVPESGSGGGVDPRWRLAALALAVLFATVLAINVTLRSRLDDARTDVAASATARSAGEAAQARTDELLSQLEESDSSLDTVVDRVRSGGAGLGAANADIDRQVSAQRAAEKALRRARSAAERADARQALRRWQLRNARTCAAAALRASSLMHDGPDVETGVGAALDRLRPVLTACRAGLR